MRTYNKRNRYLAEHNLTYDEYLQSDHWLDLKKRYYSKKSRRKCYVCGNKTGLDLHHKTYKRFGAEYLMDVIALCRKHHEAVHALHKARPNGGLWGISKVVRRKYVKKGGERAKIQSKIAKARNRGEAREKQKRQYQLSKGLTYEHKN